MQTMTTHIKHLILIGVLLGSSLALGLDAHAQTPSYVMLDFRGHAQQLPLSCESRSAVDVAAYWGVSIPEREFFARLPKTDNPHTGFVGNVYEHWGQLPPNGYGVHAEPIANLLRSYGLAAEARYGLGLEGLRAELAAGRPVIIWATPRMASQPVATYTASDGQTVSAIRYEHTVTAVGYTRYAIYVVDSATGYRWAYGNNSLRAAWDKLGQMSVVVYGRQGQAGGTASSVEVDSPGVTIRLHQPAAGARVQVPLEIRGEVRMAGFEHYNVWYGVGADPAVWRWVSGPHPVQVRGGVLTPERLGGLAPGVYTLRVMAYGAGGREEGRATFTVTP
jgi:uncharacterized protein YvpB